MQPQPPHSSFTALPLSISTSHNSHSFGFTGVTRHGTPKSAFTSDSIITYYYYHFNFMILT